MDQPSPHWRPRDIGGWPQSTGSVSAWGETDGCPTATTNPHPPATCGQATSHRDAWRGQAPRRPSGLRLLGESWPAQESRCGAHRAPARSQKIEANNAGRANQRCTPATVTLLVLLLRLGSDDRLALLTRSGPPFEHHHPQGFSGPKAAAAGHLSRQEDPSRPLRRRNPTTRRRKRANRVESEHVPDGWRLQGAMDTKAAKVPTGWLAIMGILGPACAARAHQVVDRWQANLRWAGSPASSLLTGPRPNAPSSLLSGWAA
jgi:hypothetical protein